MYCGTGPGKRVYKARAAVIYWTINSLTLKHFFALSLSRRRQEDRKHGAISERQQCDQHQQ
jgi:hypothetical protein